MKHLKHGDMIRLPAWDEMTYATVGDTYAESDPNLRAMALRNNRRHNAPDAFTTYTGSFLSSNPAHYDEVRRNASEAITVERGEIVQVGERVYMVVVNGRRSLTRPDISDPIVFHRVGPLLAAAARLNDELPERRPDPSQPTGEVERRYPPMPSQRFIKLALLPEKN